MFSEFVRWFLKYFIGWLLWMTFSRIIFGVYNVIYAQHISFKDFIGACYHGIYMDLSMAGYVVLIPLILASVYEFTGAKTISIINRYYSFFVLILFSFINAADTVIYKNWGYKLDATPLFYLKKAGEVSAFISLTNLISFIIIFSVLVLIGLWGYKKLHLNLSEYSRTKLSGIVAIVLIPVMILPIRGGFGLVPINLSAVYFSQSLFANHMAVNTVWNSIYSLTEKDKLNSKFEFMPASESAALVAALYNENNDSTTHILNTKKPNILFIILESFTGKIIDYNYQGQEVTPNLNKLSKEETYFSNMYASADRTDEGLVALFSGFPSQPKSAIMNYPDKCRKLPSILSPFKQSGYSTRFYYGGDVDFANMGSYLLLMKMDSLIDKKSFPKESYNAKWGVHDHVLFEKLYKDVTQAKAPFFYSCISLSSHPPFDIPVKPLYKGSDELTLFLNTMHYTDDALGKLINNLKRTSIWNDLLVIITADHGAREPMNSEYQVPGRFKVPMIWMGGAINNRVNYKAICSQTDLSKTLLKQLDYPTTSFYFANNLYTNSRKEFAWYAFNNGFTYLSPQGQVIYSNDSKSVISRTDTSQISLKNGQAILQEVTKRFYEY